MKRGNSLLQTASKLNTFINMNKSNEYLGNYIDKIISSRSKNIKYNSDFDYVSLDLLYTSLQIMNYKDYLTNEEFNKFDKTELKYYLNKVKGIKSIKKQVPSIKSEEQLINYIRESLANGEYVCNKDNTIGFDNGLVFDANWLVEFSSFLITSLNNNLNLSSDGMTYIFNTVVIPKKEDYDLKHFIKELKLYEYNVIRKDKRRLSYNDIKYLNDILSNIEGYDFKKLQEINSILAKEKYTLSISKKTATFKTEEKQKVEKLLNEYNCENVLHEYIYDIFKCHNSVANRNKRNLIENYEIIRSLAHAYKNQYSITECRKLFDIKDKKYDILNALVIADFYINYIYDEHNLHKIFDYSSLKLENLKPKIIDYETPKYKSIISDLSKLNKRVIVINRRINKSLNNAHYIPETNLELLEKNNNVLTRDCAELEYLIKEIKVLREELNEIKDTNRHASNINKTKISYIKEAIITGKFYYSIKNSLMVFDCYSYKDYHQTFHLEISLPDFISIILSDYNRHMRINFYES